MAKFNKMYYYTSKKEKKLNCYYIIIPKIMVEEANMQEGEVNIKIEKGKIVIEK